MPATAQQTETLIARRAFLRGAGAMGVGTLAFNHLLSREAAAITSAIHANKCSASGIILVSAERLRCGTGYRGRHSATGLRVVVKRVISTRSG